MALLNTSTISTHQPGNRHRFESARQLAAEALARVESRLAAVWPLKDYVAVNPYLGFAEQKFLTARDSLQQVSQFETLMGIDYFQRQYADGVFSRADIDVAIDELVEDNVAGAETLTANDVVHALNAVQTVACAQGLGADVAPVASQFDHANGSHWTAIVCDELSKFCSRYYDEGQAAWKNPWAEGSLYESWRSAMKHDHSMSLAGLHNFSALVEELPESPEVAVAVLLEELKVPVELTDKFLLSHAFATIGWSSWTKFQVQTAAVNGEECSDFASLLAMRLAYDCAVALQFGFQPSWNLGPHSSPSQPSEGLIRYALLRAQEVAYRRTLLGGFSVARAHEAETGRKLAQLVFCIDVRSERYRRHLEATSAQVDTFGFAGFFGMPIDYVSLGETAGVRQVPALISPAFKVYESVGESDAQIAEKRTAIRGFRKMWKEFQQSATSCFAFVETTGFVYAWHLIKESFGVGETTAPQKDGLSDKEQSAAAPSCHGLEEQGVSFDDRCTLAESALRGIGLVKNFGRLVVFCGHGCETANNPLQAGLDCGACGGHTGEPNARFAAKLLNDGEVRKALANKGIMIPEDTVFVAALHNTTTDAIKLFDRHLIPESHASDIASLESDLTAATALTRSERLGVLPGKHDSDLDRRARDWSEVRPEWGLAGNAAFVAAPRALTQSASLDGKSFLHSYDYKLDPQFAVLEQIMMAPLVVAHWINMQYYASTVDPKHFGSGNKTVHNVVGQFGVLSGNGGDLMTGLPWQSVHDGTEYQHHPKRLLGVLAAPKAAIETIVKKHELLTNLVSNGWLQLVAVDEGKTYRCTEQLEWTELAVDQVPSTSTL